MLLSRFFLSEVSFGRVKETSHGDFSPTHPRHVIIGIIKLDDEQVLFSELSVSQTYFELVYVSKIRRSNVPGFTVLRYVQVYLFYLSGKTSWVPDRPYQCTSWYAPLLFICRGTKAFSGSFSVIGSDSVTTTRRQHEVLRSNWLAGTWHAFESVIIAGYWWEDRKDPPPLHQLLWQRVIGAATRCHNRNSKDNKYSLVTRFAFHIHVISSTYQVYR